MSEEHYIESLCKQARSAAGLLAHVPTQQKNAALQKIADQLWSERNEILAANAADLSAAREAGLSEAMLDRLMLNESRLQNILADLRQVTELADPVGDLLEEKILPNGLLLRKQRVPPGGAGRHLRSSPPTLPWTWPGWR